MFYVVYLRQMASGRFQAGCDMQGSSQMQEESTLLNVASALHRMKTVASCALLGAVLAGMTIGLPVTTALASMVDLHVLGAVVGGAAGIVGQALRR
jgi:hypothetical protein